jgi:hypothetical protein
MGKRLHRFGDSLPFLVAGAILLALAASGCGMLEEDNEDPADGQGTPGVPGTGTGWAVQVLQVDYSDDATFGQSSMPGVVLGPSGGTGTGAQSLDVVSLGSGGSITVGFGPDSCVIDLAGDDLAVLENPFYIAGDEGNRFVEAGFVEVSQDGRQFFEFPWSVDDTLLLGDPERYSGLAGLEPVLPGDDLGQVGGDRFDLSDLGLDWIRYVRITDVDGDPEDPGDIMSVGYGMNGFDLDAVGAINFAQGDACR